jgi:hypothetical protein
VCIGKKIVFYLKGIVENGRSKILEGNTREELML